MLIHSLVFTYLQQTAQCKGLHFERERQRLTGICAEDRQLCGHANVNL